LYKSGWASTKTESPARAANLLLCRNGIRTLADAAHF